MPTILKDVPFVTNPDEYTKAGIHWMVCYLDQVLLILCDSFRVEHAWRAKKFST